MTSQDGLALLKQMHQRGEITDEQYDTLRRHVLWGTPVPQSPDGVPPPRSPADPGGGYVPGAATVGPDRFPDPPGRYPPDRPSRYPEPSGRHPDPRGRLPDPPGRTLDPPGRIADPPGGHPDPRRRFPVEPVNAADPVQPPGQAARRYTSRRERREAEEARAQATYPPPVAGTGPLPPAGQVPPAGTLSPAGRVSPAGQGPPAGQAPLAASTGPLPPVGEAPPRRRHRRDDIDTPPPDRPTPARRHRQARPDEVTPGRGRRAAEPERDLRQRHAPAEEVTPGRTRRPVEPDRRHAPPEEVRPGRERRPVEPEPEADRRTRRGGDTAAGKQKRRPRRRSVVAVLTSVVLALALAAGGVYWFELRRQGLPPPAYARDTCGAVRGWQQAVDSSNARLINQISRQQNKTTIRSDVTAYYTTIAGRTDQLRIAILDLGPANLTGGREYADSLAAAVGDQASGLRRLAGQAGLLDPAAATFQTDLQGILTGADTAVSAVTAALARPAAGITTDLRTTLSNEPACAPYVG